MTESSIHLPDRTVRPGHFPEEELGGQEDHREEDSEDQQEEETGGNMATADASTDDMNLEQLRAEVAKARRERDNKKVSFKAPLPSLDECPTYVIYKRKLKVWKSLLKISAMKFF